MKHINKSALVVPIVGLAALFNAASAQIYTYAGIGDADVVLDSSNAFTGVSGETLNIGSTGDATGPFAATTSALNGAGSADTIINVYGTSSLEFIGFVNEFRSQGFTVNFEDASEFLIATDGHTFRNDMVINYNSSAASVGGDKLRFQTGPIATIVNMNSGSMSITDLNFSDKLGQLNLNGGDFLATGITYTTGTGVANINFTDTNSVFTIAGAANINVLDAEFADGLFQIGGVDKVKSDFDVAFESGNLLISYTVPEPSMYALFGGLAALGLVLYRRRKHNV